MAIIFIIPTKKSPSRCDKYARETRKNLLSNIDGDNKIKVVREPRPSGQRGEHEKRRSGYEDDFEKFLVVRSSAGNNVFIMSYVIFSHFWLRNSMEFIFDGLTWTDCGERPKTAIVIFKLCECAICRNEIEELNWAWGVMDFFIESSDDYKMRIVSLCVRRCLLVFLELP